MNKVYLATLSVCVAVSLCGVARAEGPDAALYVGVKGCKMCHKKAEEGEQLAIWEKSGHAKAFANLATPEAIEAGKKVGVAEPQKSGKCLKCHSTAYNFTETLAATELPVEEGVSCESCHGPGKNYKKKETMKDRAKSIAAGMVEKTKDQCVKCHNDTSPTWKADRYTLKDGTKVGFDFEQASDKIKHNRPKK